MNNEKRYHMSLDLIRRLEMDFLSGKPPVDALCIIYPTDAKQCAFGITRPADLPFHVGDFCRFVQASQMKTPEECIQELREVLAELEEE